VAAAPEQVFEIKMILSLGLSYRVLAAIAAPGRVYTSDRRIAVPI